MGFSDAVRTCLKLKYATFQGRASRSEYWYFFLFYILVVLVLGLIAGVLGGITGAFEGGSPEAGLLIIYIPVGLAILALVIPTIAVSVRRLHDRDMSGWWYLGLMVLSAIPIVGIIASIGFLVLMCLKGTDGPNRFGRDPLGPEHSADVFA